MLGGNSNSSISKVSLRGNIIKELEELEEELGSVVREILCCGEELGPASAVCCSFDFFDRVFFKNFLLVGMASNVSNENVNSGYSLPSLSKIGGEGSAVTLFFLIKCNQGSRSEAHT